MTETKNPLKSMGVIGGALAAIGGISLFGYTVTADDMQALVVGIQAAAVAIGGVIAVIGRIRASKKIG